MEVNAKLRLKVKDALRRPNPTLFRADDGSRMSFHLVAGEGESRMVTAVRRIIIAYGAHYVPAYDGMDRHTILLVTDEGFKLRKHRRAAISVTYVGDCVCSNALLNINSYLHPWENADLWKPYDLFDVVRSRKLKFRSANKSSKGRSVGGTAPSECSALIMGNSPSAPLNQSAGTKAEPPPAQATLGAQVEPSGNVEHEVHRIIQGGQQPGAKTPYGPITHEETSMRKRDDDAENNTETPASNDVAANFERSTIVVSSSFSLKGKTKCGTSAATAARVTQPKRTKSGKAESDVKSSVSRPSTKKRVNMPKEFVSAFALTSKDIQLPFVCLKRLKKSELPAETPEDTKGQSSLSVGQKPEATVRQSTEDTASFIKSDDEEAADEKVPAKRRGRGYQDRYRTREKKMLLEWLLKEKKFKNLRGITVWKEMEKKNVVPGRPWQSLKNHFLKKLLPDIDRYGFLTEDQKAAFRHPQQSDSSDEDEGFFFHGSYKKHCNPPVSG